MSRACRLSNPTVRLIVLSMLCTLLPLTSGCAASGGSGTVGWEAESCCAELTPGQRFTVAMENLPSFLEPYFLTEVIPVMQARGLEYVWPEARDREPDIVVWLAFEQTTLDEAERPASDRAIGLGSPTRFLARVRVELIDAGSGATLAAGALARVHNALPGGYMHEERARVHIRQAFEALLDTLVSSGE